MNYHWTAFEVAKKEAKFLKAALEDYAALQGDFPAHAGIVQQQIETSQKMLRENGFDDNGVPIFANYSVWG
tara:strand:- start:631 stop:843 length:213 start_codon:yes stop_codon:yes gene_type:complete